MSNKKERTSGASVGLGESSDQLSTALSTAGSITQGSIDFKSMFEKALEIFTKQAMVDTSKLSLSDIELTKAEANSFLDAFTNLMSLSETMEVLSADKDKFRRRDEMEMLNDLRETCAAQAKVTKRTMFIIQDRINDMIESGNYDEEELMRLYGLMDVNVDSTTKIINSTSKLIQLERMSGGRQWGKRQSTPNAISYLKGLDEHMDGAFSIGKGDGKEGTVRKISFEEISSIAANGQIEKKLPYEIG